MEVSPTYLWPQFLQTSSSPTARQGPFPLVRHITLLLSLHILPLNGSDRCKICFRVNPGLFTAFILKLVFSISLFQLVPVVARTEATVSKPPLSLNKSPSLSFSLGISPSSSTFLVWVKASHHPLRSDGQRLLNCTTCVLNSWLYPEYWRRGSYA